MFRSCTKFSPFHSPSLTFSTAHPKRFFAAASTFKMPEPLKQSEVDKVQDPTVAKQWDNETPLEQRYEDFAAIADKLKIAMMGSLRDGTGVCQQRMHLATNFH